MIGLAATRGARHVKRPAPAPAHCPLEEEGSSALPAAPRKAGSSKYSTPPPSLTPMAHT